MNSDGQSSLQLVKTVHLYKRERHLCLQVYIRIYVSLPYMFIVTNHNKTYNTSIVLNTRLTEYEHDVVLSQIH